MKSLEERTADFDEIRTDIWKIFEAKGYYPQEMAGPLSNMIVELCVLISEKPLMDINIICKNMTADVKNVIRSKQEAERKTKNDL
jgi:hypothetical protein